jgi:salicylate hydroxylase
MAGRADGAERAMKALIAGGGIAGISAALSLARAGWDAHVYEQAEELTEIGAGLQLSPNACRVLDRLGVLPEMRARASTPEAAELRDGATGALVYRAELGAAAEARWGAPYLHIHRADLLDVLAGAAAGAGVQLYLGKTAEGALSRTENAALHLADGGNVEGDLVLGADGIRSRLRGVIGPVEPPTYAGQVAWRALVPAGALPAEAAQPVATVWMGPGRHLVSYPVRRGEEVNLVAVLDRADWAEEGWGLPGDADEMRAAFAGWVEPVRVLLDAVTECYLWGLFDRPEQVRWVRDRFALVGDAAHPMLPFLAQGAAMAIEDGAALVRHLSLNENVPAALTAWEAERWPRVVRVRERSRANGRLFHRPEGLARSLAHGVMSAVARSSPQFAVAQFDWLYGHDACIGT